MFLWHKLLTPWIFQSLLFCIVLFVFFFFSKKIAVALIPDNCGNFSSLKKLNRLFCHRPRQYKTNTFRIFFSVEDKNGSLTYNNRLANFEHSSKLCIFGKYLLVLSDCKHNNSRSCSCPTSNTRIHSGCPPTPANLNYELELANFIWFLHDVCVVTPITDWMNSNGLLVWIFRFYISFKIASFQQVAQSDRLCTCGA